MIDKIYYTKRHNPSADYTSDLKVYYCINNEKILGNVEFDKDN